MEVEAGAGAATGAVVAPAVGGMCRRMVRAPAAGIVITR